MGKNLRGGYKLIPCPVNLSGGGSPQISGIYKSILSTKKRIVLTGLLIGVILQQDISVEVDKQDDGLHIKDVYGYDLLIEDDDSVTPSEHEVLSVVANPTLVGTESALSGLEVDGTKYKVSAVKANPTLAGTESALTGLEVNGTKYKISGGTKLYNHNVSIQFQDVQGGKNVKIISTKSTALDITDIFYASYYGCAVNVNGELIMLDYNSGIVTQIQMNRGFMVTAFDRITALYPGGALKLESYDKDTIDLTSGELTTRVATATKDYISHTDTVTEL